MCHFYANPLSILLADEDSRTLRKRFLQPEHLTAIRSLSGFKDWVGFWVDELEDVEGARSLLEDDDFLAKRASAIRPVKHANPKDKFPKSPEKFLRVLLLLRASGLTSKSFIDDYFTGVASGIDFEGNGRALVKVFRQLNPDEVVAMATRMLTVINDGDPELGVAGWAEDADDFVKSLNKAVRKIKVLQEKCKDKGTVLRSKYTAQSKILRTTVVAQKVQLSQDSAQLTEEDTAFTKVIASLEDDLSIEICITGAQKGFLDAAAVYDSKYPDREVFVPHPGYTLEGALGRPHDYLACECCKDADGTTLATMPTTAILFHLYTEAGALVNVADLWSAYFALVGDENQNQGGGGLDEREALVRFYQGLAELKTMGFVKQSKKKADHIAKLKWL